MAILPEVRPPPDPHERSYTLIADLKREEIDELISTLESLDAVGGRHLHITVRDGFEIEGVSEALLPKLEALLSDLGVDHFALERSPVKVSGCHHLFECPRDLVGTEKITARLSRVVDESGAEGVLLDSVKGRVDPRSRLNIAVAGCTSCCNAPQVADFGIMAKVSPEVTSTPCEDGCSRCVEACEDSAITLASGRPVVNQSKCIDCGQCVRVCPTGTMRAARSGFEIFEGGHLGREPKIGARAKDWASVEEVETHLKKAMEEVVYCLEPVRDTPVEIKPDGVRVMLPTTPFVERRTTKLHIPEPPHRLEKKE